MLLLLISSKNWSKIFGGDAVWLTFFGLSVVSITDIMQCLLVHIKYFNERFFVSAQLLFHKLSFNSQFFPWLFVTLATLVLYCMHFHSAYASMYIKSFVFHSVDIILSDMAIKLLLLVVYV